METRLSRIQWMRIGAAGACAVAAVVLWWPVWRTLCAQLAAGYVLMALALPICTLLVNKLKPDAFIGVPDWAAKLGIPTTHVLDGKRPTMGYDGLLYLGNKIADQLQNPGFNVKLAQHVKLPYKDFWYQENAFKYIKGGV